MRSGLLASAVGFALAVSALSGAARAQSAAVPPFIAAAVADASRPEADRKRDADRRPVEMLAFAGVRPGDRVADFWPGGGYFTRIFAKAVGPKGHVYAVTPAEFAAIKAAKGQPVRLDADPALPNVTQLIAPAARFAAPEPLDVVWTAQNYHDLHDKFMGPADVAGFNRAVFAALKPGGMFVILDHAAPGTGLSTTDTLHRIDPATVRQEVEAAGFVFDGESPVLRNSADAHTANVFDPSIRGRTDQFVYRFRKPRR